MIQPTDYERAVVVDSEKIEREENEEKNSFGEKKSVSKSLTGPTLLG